MQKFVPTLDLIVYVHAPIEDLRSCQDARSLSKDRHISYQTLVDVDNLYNDLFAVYAAKEHSPVVVMVDNSDNNLGRAAYRTHAAISEMVLFKKQSKY